MTIALILAAWCCAATLIATLWGLVAHKLRRAGNCCAAHSRSRNDTSQRG